MKLNQVSAGKSLPVYYELPPFQRGRGQRRLVYVTARGNGKMRVSAPRSQTS